MRDKGSGVGVVWPREPQTWNLWHLGYCIPRQELEQALRCKADTDFTTVTLSSQLWSVCPGWELATGIETLPRMYQTEFRMCENKWTLPCILRLNVLLLTNIYWVVISALGRKTTQLLIQNTPGNAQIWSSSSFWFWKLWHVILPFLKTHHLSVLPG